MAVDELPERNAARLQLVGVALRLVWFSVVFGMVSGTVSVETGLRNHSLGVFAIGLGVLADVTGSAVLVWRFRAERQRPVHSPAAEARAATVVAIVLGVISAVLLVQSAAALASGSRPESSAVTLAAAGVSLVVLAPLAYAKRRLGKRMGSRALQGDGALSGIGAATSLLALIALVLYDTAGWWWANRVAALIVAVIAAAEAWHTIPHRQPRSLPFPVLRQPAGCVRFAWPGHAWPSWGMHKTTGIRDPGAAFPLPITRDDVEDRRAANRAAAVSAAGPAATGVIELLPAVLTGSVGLLGDAIHNLSDVSTSAAVFLGFRLSRRPPTDRCPYGLDRAEDLAGIGIAAVIWASVAFATAESIRKLLQHGHTTHLGAGIAGRSSASPATRRWPGTS